MREGRKRFPAGPRKARPGKGDQFRIGELIWVAGAGIGEEWRRRCDSHHTATPQLGGSPVRRGIAVQAAPAPRPRSSRAFDCLAGAQDRAACHKPATHPTSVRVERSRDTHRPCAALTGVSTALDTNGYGSVAGLWHAALIPPCVPAKAGTRGADTRPCGFTLWPRTVAGPRHPDGQRGFTLVEMLVALSLFAAIAAIGVGLLRSSVDTQDAVQARLQAMSGTNRLRAVMANDLAQAVQRSTRGPAGEAVPAFLGSATGFAFVHAGAAAHDGAPRPSVERVGYALV
ncbi:MAG: type II secretion system protein GspJ, partial [Sphingopyxis granuli]|uniref:PulJ/GspJ family protein n=1 Tax=Sphingopyxis granuli TaxID=267128 RepID=UPI003C71CECB